MTSPVILVAGTFALGKPEDHTDWWHPESDFGQAAVAAGLVIDPEPFIWPTGLDGLAGPNNEWYGGGASVRYFAHYKYPPVAGLCRRVSIIAHCFDSATEALTPTGWVPHGQLEVGTEVLTYNRDKQRAEWQPCLAVHRYQHFTEMIHLSGRMVDLMVTPDHGLWAGFSSTRRWVRWQESSAAEVLKRVSRSWFYLRTAAREADSYVPISDSWLRVLAWIMAEGNLAMRGSSLEVRIAQSDAPDGRLHILCADLDECCIPYTLDRRYRGGMATHGTWRNWDAYIIRFRRTRGRLPDWEPMIRDHLGTTKTPGKGLWALAGRQAEIFLDRYVMADGSQTGGTTYQISAKRKDHIDFLQSMVTRLGYRSRVHARPPRFGRTGIVYCLSYRIADAITAVSPRRGRTTRVPYVGTAWCVTVPNGTIFVRRNGRVALTLNSHGGQVAIYAAAQGLLIDVLMTVGTPVRKDMAPFRLAAKRNTRKWVHIFSRHDPVQLEGEIGGGGSPFVWPRQMPEADANLDAGTEEPNAHGKLHDAAIWTARVWWSLLQS